MHKSKEGLVDFRISALFRAASVPADAAKGAADK
jgi:hypothetical protein